LSFFSARGRIFIIVRTFKVLAVFSVPLLDYDYTQIVSTVNS